MDAEFKTKQRDISKYFVLFFISMICFALFIKLLIPYYQHSIYQTDAAGHAAAARFVKEELFPESVGWNMGGYMGFPHNQFYSPLFFWFVAGMSYILGIEMSFRIFVSLAVLLLPLGFYFFARENGFKRGNSLLFSSISVAFLCIPSRYFTSYSYGSSFDSLFVTGLVPNSVGLVILLFYMSFLKRINEKKYFIIESLLLAG